MTAPRSRPALLERTSLRRASLRLGAGASAALLAACAPTGVGPTPVEPVAQSPAPSPTPTCTPAPLAERAAAVLVVGMPNVTTADDPLAVELADLGVGGVFLSEPNVESAEQVAALTAGLRERAGKPLLVSTDEESGRVAITRDIVGAGPSPRRLAAERSPAEVRTFAAGIGADLAEIGVDLDLAPLLDLNDGPSGGIVGDRAFSADPAEAAEYGLAFSRGLLDGGVQPTVKHFPGQGASDTDTHAEAAVVTTPLEELRSTHLAPFQQAIDEGASVIMLNHLSYSALDADLPATLSPKTYALLRGMGFEGVAMTDSLGMGAVHSRWDFPVSAVMAVDAGVDAVLATDGRQATRMRDALVAAVESGELDEERLDEAAARVTALAGGDAETLTCLDVDLPELDDDPSTDDPATEPASEPTD